MLPTSQSIISLHALKLALNNSMCTSDNEKKTSIEHLRKFQVSIYMYYYSRLTYSYHSMTIMVEIKQLLKLILKKFKQQS